MIIRSVFKQLLFVWLAFFLMSFISYLFVRDIVNDYLNKEAKNALTYTQSKITTDLRGLEISLQDISQSVRNMILRGDSANAMREYLTEMAEYLISKEAQVIGFSDLYGTFDVFNDIFIDGSGWKPPADFVAKERPWYKVAVAAGGNIASTTPYVDASTGGIIISYSKSIFDKENNSLGVVSMDLLLDTIAKYVIETRLAEGGYGILLNENLEIIAIPKKEIMGKPLAELPTKAFLI